MPISRISDVALGCAAARAGRARSLGFGVLAFVLAAGMPLVSSATVHAMPSGERDDTGWARTEGPATSEETGLVVTTHTMVIDGVKHTYRATAGMLTIPSYDGKPRADIFHITYTLLNGAGEPHDPATRPITYAFNGGPGSSSVWLHLGTMGPKRVLMGDDEGMPPAPPYTLVENPHNWLAFTDLVFIDPVSTGYSRPVEGEDAKQFHGLEEDLRAVGEFIRLWTTRNERWSSPKFLVGESYGTTRAAGLSTLLLNDHGMAMNGIVLVSPILDFATARFDAANDLPYVLFLPTYALTAWHHKAVAPELLADYDAFREEVEAFAKGEYASALLKGDALPIEERRLIVRKLARYTGLPAEFIDRANLRVSIGEFAKRLLLEQRRTVGRLDSRYLGIDSNQINETYEHDPSYTAILAPFTATMNDYVRRELGYASDHPYEILTGRVQPWSYQGSQNRYVNVATRLRDAMHRNQHMKVLVTCGYYDMATPYFAAEDTVARMGLDPAVRDNISFTYYRSGHMMYVRIEDLIQLEKDARAFYESALPKR